MDDFQAQQDSAAARESARSNTEPVATQAKLPVFGSYISAAIKVMDTVPGHGPAPGMRSIRVWVPGVSRRQLPDIYNLPANFYFRQGSGSEQVFHMIASKDTPTRQPNAANSLFATKRRKLGDISQNDSSTWVALSSTSGGPPASFSDHRSITLQRRLKRTSDAVLKLRERTAEEVISDPGRLSPHPIDILYEYLLENNIKLVCSEAPSAQMKASRRWSPAEQGALFAYVVEEKPSTLDDWAEIGARLGRSGQACKAQFSQCHGKVEQRILDHFNNSPRRQPNEVPTTVN